MASDCCDMPMAARWRSPSSRGMSRSWLTGSMHPAAFMRLLDIIIAPSCSGEFLKNMFSISLWLMLAFTVSPVSTMSLSGVPRSITISAPHFALAILMQAITIGIIASRSMEGLSSFLMKSFMNECILRCSPTVYRNLRISSWKSTIIASAPTLTNLSNITPVRRISSTCDTSSHTMMKDSMPMNTFSVLDSRMNRYV